MHNIEGLEKCIWDRLERGREFFFFKQKTAYEILSGLVGSEVCIRDGGRPVPMLMEYIRSKTVSE